MSYALVPATPSNKKINLPIMGNRNFDFCMRLYTTLLFVIIIPIGFYTKFYNGPGAHWVNNSLGGVLYEIFWCLVIFFTLPKTRPFIIACSVFIITSILEILQLWHPPFLQAVRRTFIGKTLIGTSFVWPDFLYYLIGCSIGLLIMHLVQKSHKTG